MEKVKALLASMVWRDHTETVEVSNRSLISNKVKVGSIN